MDNPNINGNQMVTIPLKEYDRLRDQADANRLMFDRFMTLEARLMEMNHKIMDLDIKKANK